MSQQPINHPINHPLAPGYLLSGSRIDKQLSQGGFSLVYLAYDQHEMPVAIKEYLPVGLSWRPADSPVPVVNPAHQAAYNHGLASFFEEGRLLAQLDQALTLREVARLEQSLCPLIEAAMRDLPTEPAP